MVDTKQTKTIGEHYVAAELARRGWAPAFTRDGLERTDILAVKIDGLDRRMIEIQVKAARGPRLEQISWPLGLKSQMPAVQEGEFFVLVAIPTAVDEAPRYFVVPRDHLAAAAWISHEDWRTNPLQKRGVETPASTARAFYYRSSSATRIAGSSSARIRPRFPSFSLVRITHLRPTPVSACPRIIRG